MNKNKWTKTDIEKLEVPAAGQALYWDSGKGALTGFGVRVSSSGKRCYIAQSRVNGKTRRVTIGEHGTWTVDQARDEARSLLLGMDKGVDPKAEKQRDAALAVTLREIAADYVANKRTKHGPLKASSKADIERHVNKSFKAWADKPVAGITRDACEKRFKELSERGTDEDNPGPAPSQANQAFVILRALLNWARERHATDDDEYPLLPINPVKRMLRVQKLNPEAARDNRVPHDKIGAVWNVLQARRAESRTLDDRTSADYVTFLMLTGTRATEAATLTWDCVNFDEGWWHLPKEKVKNHNAVTYPMSAALRKMLEQRKALAEEENPERERRAKRPRDHSADYVFASWGKVGHITEARSTMIAVSEAAGRHITRHDLRRTYEDVAKRCKVDADERRQLLNHLASDVHRRHYSNNPDPKALASAVETIGRWITTQGKVAASAEAGRNVVAIRK